MPKLTGAAFSDVFSGDYEEKHVETYNRLRDVKLYEKALKHYKDARAKRTRSGLPKYPELQGKGEEETAAKFRWIRRHWPPTSGLAAAETEPEALTADAESLQDGEAEVSAGLVVETSEPGEAATESEKDELGVAADQKTKRKPERNPVDNSIPIPRYEDKPATIDETLMAARWAMHNAMHVVARRVTYRDAPSSMAWFFVNMALDDPKGLMTTVIDRLEKLAAKVADIKQKRYDDNREVSRVLERLEAAESRAGS